VWAANSLVIRARSLGSTEPHHFLFPYKHGNTPYDPTRHMADNGIQKRWNDLRQAAGLQWITGHVLRYQCITKLAEGGVDKITAKRIAGHITDKMWDKYSQVRFDSVREKMMGAFMPISSSEGADPQKSATKTFDRSPRKKDRVPTRPSGQGSSAIPRPQIIRAPAFSQSFTFAGGFYVTGNWAHNVGMSEDKKFCPNCKAMTMEPVEGTHITPEQLSHMEPGPPVFEGRLMPYQCPVCLHFAYQPEF
jgi:Phage integrase family